MNTENKANVIGTILPVRRHFPFGNPSDQLRPDVSLLLRAIARPDVLTAQKVEVGIVFQSMLGTREAAEYLAANNIPVDVAIRVLTQPGNRRQANG